MKAKLNKRAVEILEPREKPFEVWDSTVPGLLIRVQPSGVKSWIVQWGRGRRQTLGKWPGWTLKRARSKALQVLGQVADGNAPEPKRRRQTLRQFLDNEYRPWAEAKLKTGKGEADRIESRFAYLLDKPLPEITAWLVEKNRTARLKAGISARTADRDIAALRGCLRQAVRWRLLNESPLLEVENKKVDPTGRVRFLDTDEEKALRAALDAREQRMRERRENGNRWRIERGRNSLPTFEGRTFADHLKPMVLLSMNTGLRRGELFALEWSDISLDRKNLTVRAAAAKGGRRRDIPLNAEALAVLTEWRKQNGVDGFVFPGRNGDRFNNTRKAWGAVLKDAGIKDFRWHDLRHHFASRLVQNGVDLNTVRELLGHGDIKMTLRYAHLAPEHKAAAVAVLVR